MGEEYLDSMFKMLFSPFSQTMFWLLGQKSWLHVFFSHQQLHCLLLFQNCWMYFLCQLVNVTSLSPFKYSYQKSVIADMKIMNLMFKNEYVWLRCEFQRRFLETNHRHVKSWQLTNFETSLLEKKHHLKDRRKCVTGREYLSIYHCWQQAPKWYLQPPWLQC